MTNGIVNQESYICTGMFILRKYMGIVPFTCDYFVWFIMYVSCHEGGGNSLWTGCAKTGAGTAHGTVCPFDVAPCVMDKSYVRCARVSCSSASVRSSSSCGTPRWNVFAGKGGLVTTHGIQHWRTDRNRRTRNTHARWKRMDNWDENTMYGSVIPP